MHQAVSVCKQNISIAVVPLLVLCLVLSTESLVYVLLYQSLQMLVCVCVCCSVKQVDRVDTVELEKEVLPQLEPVESDARR